VSVGGIKVQKYSAFLREIVVPTNFNIMAIRPLRGSGLVVCDPTLVFAVIDALFGGAGKFHTRIEGRDFSATEQRIIQMLAETLKPTDTLILVTHKPELLVLVQRLMIVAQNKVALDGPRDEVLKRLPQGSPAHLCT